ncbi:uncharacterized protein EAF01_005965 [Botrytis porri]|uniref:uncharacterized protein n=1 Tax=Botrytis porri TaxID=87229 RepID=UPI0019000598|nr:uncharacterized protein EAF01_005965 [Botrytis porri]KAF7905444.1 hypothetical protein EAF01_005965 [Botrytis porri]
MSGQTGCGFLVDWYRDRTGFQGLRDEMRRNVQIKDLRSCAIANGTSILLKLSRSKDGSLLRKSMSSGGYGKWNEG